MNRRSIAVFIAIACLLLLRSASFAQLPTPTYGWNLGNTLEPPGGEGSWGPAATQNLINSVADAGYNTIRIPVAWDSHANQSTYQIDAAWMARVKQVVDWCYAKNLYVIINCHWDNGWLENHITGTVDPTINAKMNSYWTQIATTFKGYDSKLIFAGANEPNAGTAAQVSTLMSYYKTFIDAVRATGGSNSSRWLAIQGPNTDIDKTDSLMNTMPSDSTSGRLMVEVHYYSPYQFALMDSDQSWGAMFYFWGAGYHSTTLPSRNATWGEEAYMDAEFDKMQSKFISRGIPVILGEFGAYRRGNLIGADATLNYASTTYFNKCVVDKANNRGIKPIYWNTPGGIFDWTSGAVTDQSTITALTGGAALPPTGVAVAVAPAIITQPAGQTVTAGNPVSFFVSATGTAPLSYQWSKGTTAIAVATSASYAISSTASADAGSYTVTITNAAGSVTSNPATLTVNAGPTFTTQPLSQPAFVGSTISFVALATSATPITYQWQKGGINILNATGATLTLTNVQLSDASSYAVIATDSGGSATSRFARLVALVPQQNAITYATTVSSTGVTAGGIVNFDYFVTNVGTKAWGVHHYLSIRDVNNTFVAFSSLIGILPGETTTANLKFPAPTTPGTYTYYVQGLEDGVEFFSTQTTVTLTVLAPVTNAITYNTTSFPVSAAPGSNVIFTYNVTNTGTATWGATHILSLKNGGGSVISSTPLTVLAPGASKTVNLSFTVPTTPGTYNYTVQASQTGVGNFGTQANLTLVVLAPRPNAIVYNRVRYPGEVVPGAVLSLKYTLSNAGAQAWGAGHYVSLRDSNESYLAFIALNGTATSATKTVEFTLTAPTTPGKYTYYVQALEDGIEFFSTQDVVIVTVVALPLGNAVSYNTSTIPVTAAPGATVNFTANVTNCGTRTWGTTHYLSFRDVDNTFLAFPSLNGVTPGASRTSSLSFTAPTTPGIYTYTLQAFEDGVAFFEMADTVVLMVQ